MVETPRNKMLLGDAVTLLGTLPDGAVDLIVTDPAYDSLEKWRAFGTTTRLKKSDASSNEWFPVVSPDYFPKFFAQCYRVLKRDTHIYVMCDDEMSYILRPMLEDAGFNWRKKIIWHKVGSEKDLVCPHCGKVAGKTRGKGTPGMGYFYRSEYEVILLADKGSRPTKDTDKSVRDVLEVPRIKTPDAYPTQKPEALLEIFISQSSRPGDLVLDPFAGSGATLNAARTLGRDYLGFDVTEKAVDAFNSGHRWAVDPPPTCSKPEAPPVSDIFTFFGTESHDE